MIKNCELVILVILGLSGYSLCNLQFMKDPEHPEETQLTYAGKPVNANDKCDVTHNSYTDEYKWECYTHCVYTGYGTGWCFGNEENKSECKCSKPDNRYQKPSYMAKLKGQADGKGGIIYDEDDDDIDLDDDGEYDENEDDEYDEDAEEEADDDEEEEEDEEEDEDGEMSSGLPPK